MTKLVLAGLLLVGFSGLCEARSIRVRGSTTKSGTYRKPHYRTSPNRRKSDNWSTKGNTNPHTGKKGSKNP